MNGEFPIFDRQKSPYTWFGLKGRLFFGRLDQNSREPKLNFSKTQAKFSPKLNFLEINCLKTVSFSNHRCLISSENEHIFRSRLQLILSLLGWAKRKSGLQAAQLSGKVKRESGVQLAGFSGKVKKGQRATTCTILRQSKQREY